MIDNSKELLELSRMTPKFDLIEPRYRPLKIEELHGRILDKKFEYTNVSSFERARRIRKANSKEQLCYKRTDRHTHPSQLYV